MIARLRRREFITLLGGAAGAASGGRSCGIAVAAATVTSTVDPIG
jgi:hypothetical protein